MKLKPWILVATLLLLAPLPTEAQIIDDFESYADTAALQLAWALSPTLDTTTPGDGGGAKSMRIGATTVANNAGVETERLFGPSLDLSGQTLYLWCRRDPASALNTRFTLTAWEGPSGCSVNGVFSDSAWHLLALDVSMCVGGGAAVDRIHVYMSNNSGATADIWGNVDDVTLDGLVSVELTALSVE